jgi:hypothetical protein
MGGRRRAGHGCVPRSGPVNFSPKHVAQAKSQKKDLEPGILIAQSQHFRCLARRSIPAERLGYSHVPEWSLLGVIKRGNL